MRGRGAKKGTEGVAGGAVLGREGRKGAEVVWGTATRTDTDRHGRARTASVGDGFTWNLVERSECRGQRSGGTEQPEQPNSLLTQRARTKRKRRKRFFWGGGREGGDGAKRSLKHTGARPVDGAGRGDGARRGQRSGNSRLERAESRGRRSGGTEQPEQPLRSTSAAWSLAFD